MSDIDPEALAWDKMEGLLPVIVQDEASSEILMLGYMNRDALEQTLHSGKVTFFSRSRQQLWTKGETSGHHLHVTSVRTDCDGDALLVTAEPDGPTCHLGQQSCFGGVQTGIAWLGKLQGIVSARAKDLPEGSYTATLLKAGPQRIAQKVGEEGVEVALAGASNDSNLAEEIADLAYHLTVLMEARQVSWSDVAEILKRRHG